MKIIVIVAAALSVVSGRPNYYGYQGIPAPIGADGRVMETPEVALAKAAHLAAFAQAASRVHYAGPSTRIQHGNYQGYHGPAAPLNHEGRVMDTPEVAQAKAAHFAAYHHAASQVPIMSYENYGDSGMYHGVAGYGSHNYHGSSAPLGHDGRVVDTPEVAHAKAAHLAAHAHAATHGHVPYGPYGDY